MAIQTLINLYGYYEDMAARYDREWRTEEEYAKYNQFSQLRDAVGREIEARM